MQQQPTTPRVRRSDRYEKVTETAEQPAVQPTSVRRTRTEQMRPAGHGADTTAAEKHTAGPQQNNRIANMRRPVQQDMNAVQRSYTPGKRMLQSVPDAIQSEKSNEREEEPLPRVWKTLAITLSLLILAGVAAGLLMQAYLKRQEDARVKVQQQIVERHPMQYRSYIEQYAAEYNLQPAYVSAIILNESSFNTRAESGVGARGLMQLMPETAQWIAHRLGMDATYQDDLLWDAQTNIRFGCWYLNYLSKLFAGDPVTVTSAYHAGQGEISGWLNNRTYAPDGKALNLTTMPDGPTKTYAGRVTRDYGIYDALYFHAFNPEEQSS